MDKDSFFISKKRQDAIQNFSPIKNSEPLEMAAELIKDYTNSLFEVGQAGLAAEYEAGLIKNNLVPLQGLIGQANIGAIDNDSIASLLTQQHGHLKKIAEKTIEQTGLIKKHVNHASLRLNYCLRSLADVDDEILDIKETKKIEAAQIQKKIKKQKRYEMKREIKSTCYLCVPGTSCLSCLKKNADLCERCFQYRTTAMRNICIDCKHAIKDLKRCYYCTKFDAIQGLKFCSTCITILSKEFDDRKIFDQDLTTRQRMEANDVFQNRFLGKLKWDRFRLSFRDRSILSSQELQKLKDQEEKKKVAEERKKALGGKIMVLLEEEEEEKEQDKKKKDDDDDFIF